MDENRNVACETPIVLRRSYHGLDGDDLPRWGATASRPATAVTTSDNKTWPLLGASYGDSMRAVGTAPAYDYRAADTVLVFDGPTFERARASLAVSRSLWMHVDCDGADCCGEDMLADVRSVDDLGSDWLGDCSHLARVNVRFSVAQVYWTKRRVTLNEPAPGTVVLDGEGEPVRIVPHAPVEGVVDMSAPEPVYVCAECGSVRHVSVVQTELDELRAEAREP